MHNPTLPSRFANFSSATFTLLVAFGALVMVSAGDVAPSLEQLGNGMPNMFRLVERMMPPSTEPAFLERMAWRTVETFQIALVGTVIGIIFSLPIAWLSARRVSPAAGLSFFFKMNVSLFRTIPDLVWALLFVAAVGLGAVAGTMTIVVDTIGFCGRFFAEAMEDADKAPQDALAAQGASRFSILLSAVIPDAMPSLINTALFALEKAVRSSVLSWVSSAPAGSARSSRLPSICSSTRKPRRLSWPSS